MRSLIIIGGTCVVAIVIGVLLFIYGPSEFHLSSLGPSNTSVKFTTLNQGMNAATITERTNYRIQNEDQLAALWSLVYGDDTNSVPTVDFTKNEVLAVFDGSHSTGGYSVSVESIVDASGTRMVNILRQAPGPRCVVLQSRTSPFEIVELPKTSLSLSHTDITATSTCL